MIRLDKKLVDEVFRLAMKYYETGDTFYLPALLRAKYALQETATWHTVDLVNDLALYTQTSDKGTYDDIYKALAVFGIIVEDNENETTRQNNKALEKREANETQELRREVRQTGQAY